MVPIEWTEDGWYRIPEGTDLLNAGGASLLPALFTFGTGCVTCHSFEITELPEEDPEPAEDDWEY